MIELIAIILLSRMNGQLAEKKGLKFWTWVGYTVLCWIGFEFIGALIGIGAFGQENIILVYLLAIVLGASSYFFIRSILNKKPDITDEDINRIGVKDLYP